uniref:Putative glycine decarboxylase P subunit n=1 Tax=Triticum turgidum subsp. durum TaxID=4567 RepID=Q575T4_TRITD|nr:putative glycine decarboxylase P subunit [Triticum turgidum subsp. durum]
MLRSPPRGFVVPSSGQQHVVWTTCTGIAT